MLTSGLEREAGVDESSVPALAAAAADGDEAAWNELVTRYLPLVLSIARAHRLNAADAADVNQTVWLRLVEHLGDIRDPQAIPKWIGTVARNECLRVIRTDRRTTSLDETDGFEPSPRIPEQGVDEAVLRAERHRVLREAYASLSERCRTLLALLTADPPVAYADISARMGMRVGSIGPTRIRCLDKLRSSPIVQSFFGTGGDGNELVAMG